MHTALPYQALDLLTSYVIPNKSIFIITIIIIIITRSFIIGFSMLVSQIQNLVLYEPFPKCKPYHSTKRGPPQFTLTQGTSPLVSTAPRRKPTTQLW